MPAVFIYYLIVGIPSIFLTVIGAILSLSAFILLVGTLKETAALLSVDRFKSSILLVAELEYYLYFDVCVEMCYYYLDLHLPKLTVSAESETTASRHDVKVRRNDEQRERKPVSRGCHRQQLSVATCVIFDSIDDNNDTSRS